MYKIILLLCWVLTNQLQADPLVRFKCHDGRIIQGQLLHYEKGIFEILCQASLIVLSEKEVVEFCSVSQPLDAASHKSGRSIAFYFPDPRTGVVHIPWQVLLDGRPIRPQERFRTDQQYQLTVKIRGFQPVTQPLYLPAGHGPYVVQLTPQPLHCFRFNWRGPDRLILDGQSYNLEIYTDDKVVPTYQVILENYPQYTACTFYAPAEVQQIAIYLGFYVGRVRPQALHGCQKINAIDLSRLLAHLQHCSTSQACKRLHHLTQQYRNLLQQLRRLELERLIHYVKKLKERSVDRRNVALQLEQILVTLAKLR